MWKLCKFLEEHADVEVLDGVYVIFVSNATRTVPIWKQQSSEREDTMVVWDYHVILYSTYGGYGKSAATARRQIYANFILTVLNQNTGTYFSTSLNTVCII